MKKLYLSLLLSIAALATKSQITVFEKSNQRETATYFETIEFYKKLDQISSKVAIKTMGPTDAGYPLHVIMVSGNSKFDPNQWHKQGKVVIMVNNGIHPGEPDGVDASMLLVRNFVNGKLLLPQNVVLAIIPIYNIGGSLNRNSSTRVNQNGPESYGFRGNAQNLDLNRDFTKCDSKNAASFAKIFHWLNPDILIDNHVSDGADFQHTMTMITTQYEKLGKTAGTWLRNVFEPQIYQGMKNKNWDLIPYVEFDGADFDKGITMFNETPRYSSGYAALFNCFSFIPETHMLKSYAERVRSTYDLMVTFLEKASINAKEIVLTRKLAFEEQQRMDSFALKFVPEKTRRSEISFSGYSQDSAVSQATGLMKMFYNRNAPYSRKIKFYNYFSEENIVQAPKAYVMGAGWHEVMNRLKLNNIQYRVLKHDTTIFVATYKITNYKSRANAYEKHHANYNVSVKKQIDSILFLKGDYYIPINQPGKRYLIEMLEPTGDDSFFAWNFFDAILQQKEGYSEYRWEDAAADVLKKDTALQIKLAEKRKADPAFDKNSSAILNFIYVNSRWLEKTFMRYPVFRVEK